MLLKPLLQVVQKMRLHFRVNGINRHEVLPVAPVVGPVVVCGNLFPDPVGQEIHCIAVPFLDIVHRHGPGAGIIGPVGQGHFGVGGAVENLPELLGIIVEIDSELLFVI